MVEQGYLDHWGRIAKLAKADARFAFAQRIVDMQKVVLTNKLEASRWPRTRVARGTIDEVATNLKRQAGNDIICFGGVGFASALLRAGVVDELQLYVNPVALGVGESIYGDGRTRLSLRPLKTRSFDCGMVVNTYEPGEWTEV
jgi:dihydrofolate reductase